MKTQNPLVGWILNAFLAMSQRAAAFQGSTKHGTRSKEDLPAGYAGAKLAHKARRQQVGVRHVTRQS